MKNRKSQIQIREKTNQIKKRRKTEINKEEETSPF